MLCSISFPSEVNSVVLDTMESVMFAGCSNGIVYKVPMWTDEMHIKAATFGVEANAEMKLQGHT